MHPATFSGARAIAGEPRFAEYYCRRHYLDRECFMVAMLQATLHRHVRPFYSLIAAVWPHYFDPDHEFIAAIGRMRSYDEYEEARNDYATRLDNQGFFRRWLRLRISAKRMHRVVQAIYVRTRYVLPPEEIGDSLSPFETTGGNAAPVRGLLEPLAGNAHATRR